MSTYGCKCGGIMIQYSNTRRCASCGAPGRIQRRKVAAARTISSRTRKIQNLEQAVRDLTAIEEDLR